MLLLIIHSTTGAGTAHVISKLLKKTVVQAFLLLYLMKNFVFY